MRTLSNARLKDILSQYRTSQVAVIGDFCLDAYWYADMTRSQLSRETPRFNLPVVNEVYSLGGGANVASNLKSLGIKAVMAITILGSDWRGEILKSELLKSNIDLTYSLISSKRVTSTFIKPILKGYGSKQEDSRIDFLSPLSLDVDLEAEFISKINECLQHVNVVAVVDQLPNGVITSAVRECLIGYAKVHPEKIFIADSRDKISAYSYMILKPNEIEARQALLSERSPFHPETTGEIDIIQAGRKLRKQARRPIFITMSDIGSLLFEDIEPYLIPAIPVTPPIDIVGAGDAYLAGLCSALSAGATLQEAGLIASMASSVVIKKLETTGTATAEEIMNVYRSLPEEWGLQSSIDHQILHRIGSTAIG